MLLLDNSTALAPPGRAAPSSSASRYRRAVCALGVTVVMIAAGFAYAQAPASDPVIARVNGVEIRQSDLALAEEDLGRDVPANDEQAKRDYIVNYLTDL